MGRAARRPLLIFESRFEEGEELCAAQLLRENISERILWEWMTKTHLERLGAHFER